MEKGEGSWGLEEVVLGRTISKNLKYLFNIFFLNTRGIKYGDRYRAAVSTVAHSQLHSHTNIPPSYDIHQLILTQSRY
jgi:hypothetical protein